MYARLVNVTTAHHRKQILLAVVLVILSAPLVPAKKEGTEPKAKSGNFSQSPTNHEEVLARNKAAVSSSSSSSNDDYWVGSNKLEFKPHPLLLPATSSSSPTSIPIPIIEMGLPPPSFLPSSSSEESSEEDKQRKNRKGRDKRKKSRNQRRLTHRTLWANASTNSAYILRALQNNPQLLQQQTNLYNSLRQPVIIPASNIVSPLHLPYTIPSQTTRNEEFHGSAATWNINHPGSNLNQSPHYYPPTTNLGEDNREAVPQTYPRTSSIQNIQVAYPQVQVQQQSSFQIPHHFQTQQQMGSAPAPQQTLGTVSLSGPSDSGIFTQVPSSSYGVNGGGGSGGGTGSGGRPILVYVSTPSGRGIPQTSTSTIKDFTSMNEIPVDMDMKPQVHYISGPPTGSHPTASTSTTSHNGSNPQFFRNNFIRRVMDRLSNVGKMLPIPFVTKYSHHPPLPQQQTYSRHRRM